MATGLIAPGDSTLTYRRDEASTAQIRPTILQQSLPSDPALQTGRSSQYTAHSRQQSQRYIASQSPSTNNEYTYFPTNNKNNRANDEDDDDDTSSRGGGIREGEYRRDGALSPGNGQEADGGVQEGMQFWVNKRHLSSGNPSELSAEEKAGE